eukprot:GHVU01076329.1.p1 GENE.GHVU01076329.1~~GHVU01076329.1.p1  ORF type:complete len:188 (+),score=25.25 GHVU01076329.1:1-564(+)
MRLCPDWAGQGVSGAPTGCGPYHRSQPFAKRRTKKQECCFQMLPDEKQHQKELLEEAYLNVKRIQLQEPSYCARRSHSEQLTSEFDAVATGTSTERINLSLKIADTKNMDLRALNQTLHQQKRSIAAKRSDKEEIASARARLQALLNPGYQHKTLDEMKRILEEIYSIASLLEEEMKAAGATRSMAD